MKTLTIAVLFCSMSCLAQIQGGDFNGPLAPGKFPPKDSNGNVMQISILRVWDSGQKWGQINTASGVYNWTQMDSIVNGLPSTVGLLGPMDIEYTFGYTPQWAGGCSGSPDPSTCLPGPSNFTVSTKGAMTSGSKVLTSSGDFTQGANIVGATLTVNGAGAGGANLTTTVASYQSASQVTLAGAASTTVSNATVTSAFGGGSQCANPSDYSCLHPNDIDSGTCTSSNTVGCGIGTDAHFQAFVSTLANRYTTKIKYYGLNNESDSPNFWCQQGGTVPCGGGNSSTTANTPALKRDVRMAWDAKKITHCANPNAIIIGVGGHVGTMTSWYENYNATTINAPAGSIGGCSWAAQTITGKDTYDWPNEHMRGQGSCTAGTFNGTSNCDPTSVIPAYNAMVSMLTHDGLLARPICNDEYGWNGNTQAGTTDNQAAYVAIENILQSSFSAPRMTCMVWYTYDAGQGPLLNQPGGLAWNVSYGWTHNITGTIGNYTKTGNIYTVPGTTNTGTPFLMAWDMSQNCNSGCTTSNHVFGSQYAKYVDLTGVQHNTTGGNGTVALGLKPVQVLQTAPTLTLAVNGGNNQTGTVSTLLPSSLSVLATSNGTPQAGVSVSFSDLGSGGGFSASPVTTNGSGIASTNYTLPSSAGAITISGSATSYTSATFSETATAATHVLTISVSTGNNQTGNVSTTLPIALSIVATDNGTPQVGVSISFSDGGAGGVFGNPTPTTDGTGTASTTYTLPATPQVITVTVSSTGYTPTTFTETARTQIVAANSGNNQTGSTSTSLPQALQALVTTNGVPTSGLIVTFTDGGAGGVFGNPTVTSDSNGFAATSYTLPSSPQVITVTVTTPGYTPGTFTETAATKALSAIGGNGQAGAVSTQLVLPLTVSALVNGVPTQGVVIAFTDSGAGGAFGTSPCTTDVTGACSTTYTLPSSALSISITASSSGYSPTVFSETSFVPSTPSNTKVSPGVHVSGAFIH